MLQEIFQMNILPVSIVIYMLITILSNRRNNLDITRKFLVMLIGTILLILIDNFDLYCYRTGINGFVHKFVTIIGYNLRINILLAIILTILRHNTNQYKLLTILPAFICSIITLSGLLTNLVISFDSNTNDMIRGPLAFTPHITLGFYCLLLIYLGIKKISEQNKCEGWTILTGCALCCFATLIESNFLIHGPLVGTISLAIIFYYLTIQMEHFKKDSLTGCWNRLTFDCDLKEFKEAVEYVMMIDLNNLKQLNDKDGHNAGDKALKTLAYNVKKCLPNGCKLYRIGGDEFAIMCNKNIPIEIEKLQSKISNSAKDTKYEWAVGYAKVGDEQNIKKALKIADKNMYANKIEMKSI